MRNRISRFAILAALLSTLSVTGNGQNTTTSGVTGVVTDTAGAVVPGVIVTLSNPGKGTKLTSKTDSNGSYRFTSLQPASGYVETFSHDGFVTTEVKDIYLQVGATRTQNVKLAVGSATEVSVSARGNEATLNTTDATIGNNIDPQQVLDLPVQNRNNPQVLFQLQPGIANGAVTGARQDQSETTIDGMDVNDTSAGQSGSTFSINAGIPVEAVQQFSAQVAGLTAATGTGSGGQFQVVTKSGTNHFHGSAFEYHRDTAMAANTWFLNNSGIKRTPLIQNQFGGQVSGPIWRDKLFFSVALNNSRIIQSSSASRTVPLDSFRAGTIGYINNTAGCPTTGVRRSTNPGCVTDLPNAGTTSVTALDPQHIGQDAAVLAAYAARYPHANDLSLGDGINTGGYRFVQKTPDILYGYLAKVDYNLTSKQKIFLQYHASREDRTYAVNQFDTDPFTYPFQDRSYGYVVNHNWQISSNKVNDFYYGTTVTKFNFPTNFTNGTPNQFSFGPLSAPYGSFSSQKRRIPVPTVRDDFSWIAGHHTIQFGGTFKFIKTNSQLIGDYNTYAVGLGGSTTTLGTVALGAPYRPADLQNSAGARSLYDSAFVFDLGRIASIGSNYNFDANGTPLNQGTGAIRAYRYYQTEAYLQDTWKVTPQLTIAYGVRYQYYTVPYEVHGYQSISTTSFADYTAARIAQSAAGTTGNTAVPFMTYQLGGKANNGPASYQDSLADIAPRVAFAYAPTQKMVIHGGANLQYDRTVINAINFVQDQLSYLFQGSASRLYGGSNAIALGSDPRLGSSPLPAPPAAQAPSKPFRPYVTSANAPYGLATGQYNYSVDPKFKTPYSITFNLGLQREIPGKMILKADYYGRLGRRLIGQSDANQIIDVADKTSGQTLQQAFANLSTYARANNGGGSPASQPFLENSISKNLANAYGYSTNTSFLYDNFGGDLLQYGDISDVLQFLSSQTYTYGIASLPANLGMAAQFGANSFITNQGTSNYHGLLLTVQKNPTHGLRFDINYTLSHSLDNVSSVANYIGANTGTGQICDFMRTDKCYGNSDFDIRHVVNSNFSYELPFGRGKMFGSTAPRAVDLALGGWRASGIVTWRSGLPYSAFSDAYVMGFVNNAPAVFKGDRSLIKTNIHKVGSSLYQFANPATAGYNNGNGAFTGLTGFNTGSRNMLRGAGATTFDASLAKSFDIFTDKFRLKIQGDAFNVLNHPVFSNPSSTSMNSTTFGQITTVAISSRVLQVSGRIEF